MMHQDWDMKQASPEVKISFPEAVFSRDPKNSLRQPGVIANEVTEESNLLRENKATEPIDLLSRNVLATDKAVNIVSLDNPMKIKNLSGVNLVQESKETHLLQKEKEVSQEINETI